LIFKPFLFDERAPVREIKFAQTEGRSGQQDRDDDRYQQGDRDDDHRRGDRDDDRGGYRGGRGSPQLSASDQKRFDSYYSRWLQYRATNNRDEIVSMEKRMNDVYAHYGIPIGTPYSRVASNGYGYRGDGDADDYGRGNGHWGNKGHGYGQWQGRLSSSDQSRFDSYYSRWLNYRATNNRDEIISMEKRMNDIYNHYGIPIGTPYGQIASQGQRGRY